MNTIPALVPISDIRQRQNEILASLARGPIVLTQRGHGAAVLVSVDQWNQMIERLEWLEAARDAELLTLAKAQGGDMRPIAEVIEETERIEKE